MDTCRTRTTCRRRSSGRDQVVADTSGSSSCIKILGRFGCGLEMTVRLGKFRGNGRGLWLRLQQAYDLWHAERLLADAFERIPTPRSAA
jgi:hypothetical protein